MTDPTPTDPNPGTASPQTNYSLAQKWLQSGSEFIVAGTAAVDAEQWDRAASLAGLAMVQLTQAQVCAQMATVEVTVQAANAANAATNGIGQLLVQAVQALAPQGDPGMTTLHPILQAVLDTAAAFHFSGRLGQDSTAGSADQIAASFDEAMEAYADHVAAGRLRSKD